MTERRPIRGRVAPLGLVLALLVSGCSFHKTVVNEHFRDLDVSRIQAGKTTWLDIIDVLGPPLPRNINEVGSVRPSLAYLVYDVREERCAILGPQLGLILPFTWCYEASVFELAVEFDRNHVVESVWVTERDMIWRPFQGEDDLSPPRTRRVTP